MTTNKMLQEDDSTPLVFLVAIGMSLKTLRLAMGAVVSPIISPLCIQIILR